jgi:hypothetical protein
VDGRIALRFGVLLLVLWSTPAPAQAPASIGTVDALVGDCMVVRSGGIGASALGVGAESGLRPARASNSGSSTAR